MKLVLASTSPYRRALLSRLGLAFTCRSPGVDEGELPGETPIERAERLAIAKAQAGGEAQGNELVIGSDQVAILGQQVLHKPGHAAANRAQLKAASGRRVEFLTAVCLLNAAEQSFQVRTVTYRVRFRRLSALQIRNYVAREPAFDCAGGFRCEGLGAALFEAMEGEDPTALVGLPLIALCDMLRRVGVDPLG